MAFRLVIWIIWVLSPMYIAFQFNPVIKIEQGYIRGTTLRSARSNKTFAGFMGIPYAKPPIGELRFKSPQQPEPWSRVRNATVEGSVCPQINITGVYEGEEDCLFLNVFTPELPAGPKSTLKPVMVWIHGGGNIYNSGDRKLSGPDFFVDQGLIFVSMNYRLCIFGFLNLRNSEVPGNAAMKDQVMALQWVQKNIKVFGGDPNKVTIVGNSAGSASVQYHLLSPMSKGLFQGAISESGSALNPWVFCTAEYSLKELFDLGKNLSLNTNDTKILLNQLKSVNTMELVNTYCKPLIRGAYGIRLAFCPTTDIEAEKGDVFLPDTPINIITSGNIYSVPYIAGFTSREGLFAIQAIKAVLNRNLEENIKLEIPDDLDIEKNSSVSQEVVRQIKNFYFHDDNSTNDTIISYADLATDVYFFNGIYCTIKLHAALSQCPVYAYEFSYSGIMSVFKILQGAEGLPGVIHQDELPYIFPITGITGLYPTRKFKPGSSELLTSKRMVKMWTNFIKTRNPTPTSDPLLQNVTWLPVTTSQFNYLSIDDDLQLRRNPRKKNVKLWENIYSKHGPDESRIQCCWKKKNGKN